MSAMKEMMMSMKKMMESKHQTFDRPSDKEEDYYRDSDPEDEPDMEEDDDEFKVVTDFDKTNNDEIDDPSTSGSSKQTKRYSQRTKGESPAKKKQHSQLTLNPQTVSYHEIIQRPNKFITTLFNAEAEPLLRIRSV